MIRRITKDVDRSLIAGAVEPEGGSPRLTSNPMLVAEGRAWFYGSEAPGM